MLFPPSVPSGACGAVLCCDWLEHSNVLASRGSEQSIPPGVCADCALANEQDRTRKLTCQTIETPPPLLLPRRGECICLEFITFSETLSWSALAVPLASRTVTSVPANDPGPAYMRSLLARVRASRHGWRATNDGPASS